MVCNKITPGYNGILLGMLQEIRLSALLLFIRVNWILMSGELNWIEKRDQSENRVDNSTDKEK
jgi:hypothetical protein